MDEQDKKLIWFIDNEDSQLRLYSRLLDKGLVLAQSKDREVFVEDCPARSHKHDYLDILDNPQTATIIIDQVLKDKGGVDHTGIELAQYLRSLNSILPMYILTNYPSIDQLGEGEWSIDNIIDKGTLSDNDQKLHAIGSQLLRRIDVYQKIHGQRELRFRELLKKSMNETLSDLEQKELDELEFERSAATLARERVEQAVPDKLDEVLDQLQDLRKMFEDLDETNKD